MGKRYKVRDILQVLRRDGWVFLRSRGSHRQFAHPTKAGVVTLSYHSANDDLHPKTAACILRQAGLTSRRNPK